MSNPLYQQYHFFTFADDSQLARTFEQWESEREAQMDGLRAIAKEFRLDPKVENFRFHADDGKLIAIEVQHEWLYSDERGGDLPEHLSWHGPRKKRMVRPSGKKRKDWTERDELVAKFAAVNIPGHNALLRRCGFEPRSVFAWETFKRATTGIYQDEEGLYFAVPRMTKNEIGGTDHIAPYRAHPELTEATTREWMQRKHRIELANLDAA